MEDNELISDKQWGFRRDQPEVYHFSSGKSGKVRSTEDMLLDITY